MTERTRTTDAPSTPEDRLVEVEPAYSAYGIKRPSIYQMDEEVGVAIPAAMAFLGMMFACCVLLVCGLPPLTGFLAKFALLTTMLRPDAAQQVPASAWVLGATIVLSGLVSLIALSRIGMRLFWSDAGRTEPRLRLLEAAPVAVLVLTCLGLTMAADPVARYLDSTARSLHQPDTYIRAVLSQQTRRERPESRP
jgi:multicomponent K+:H+ antiporter subunit D